MKKRDFLVKWKLYICIYSALAFDRMVQISKIEILLLEEMIWNKNYINYMYLKPFAKIMIDIYPKAVSQVKVKKSQIFHISWKKSFSMAFSRTLIFIFKIYGKFSTNSCIIDILLHSPKQFMANFSVKLKWLERVSTIIQKYSYICIYTAITFYRTI